MTDKLVWADDKASLELLGPDTGDIRAIGVSKNLVVALVCSKRWFADLLVAHYEEGKRPRFLSTARRRHRREIEALIPKSQWPPAPDGRGSDADPIVLKHSNEHAKYIRARRAHPAGKHAQLGKAA